MKYAFYAILTLAIASIVFNATRLNFNALLKGDSQIAAISIVVALCVAVLMGIIIVSKRIATKVNNPEVLG